MTFMKKSLSLFLSIVMVLLTVPTFVLAAENNELPENYLGLKTELYVYDETLGDWVVADKVGRNQEVKARVFVETGFAAGDGQVIFFYNDDAFESDYIGNIFPIEVNTNSESTTGRYSVSGMMTSPAKSHASMKKMIERGYFTEEFMANNTPVTFSFYFTDYKCHQINGEHWFAEFTLRTKSDAVGQGDFYVLPSTIQNPDEGYFAYTTFAKGDSEGASALDYTIGMDEWEATLSVESKPISTGYGRIRLDANGGVFSSTQTDSASFDFVEGATVEISEEPSREGYVFAGYEPAIPSVMTEDVYNIKALWNPAENTPFNVKIHYYDFSSGVTLQADKDITLSGTTGNKVEIVDVLPENPAENTHYITFDKLAPEFNKVRLNADNTLSTVIAADGSSTLEVYFEPVVHEVTFDSDGGAFSDGATTVTFEVTHGDYLDEYVIPDAPSRDGCDFIGWDGFDESARIESDVVFNALWESKLYDFTYVLAFNQFTVQYAFGDPIRSDVYTEKQGHTFIGWVDQDGEFHSELPETMPAQNLVYTCIYEINSYNAVFNATEGAFSDGSNSKSFEVEFENVINAPENNPVRDGYEFVGWMDESGKIYYPNDELGNISDYDVVFEAVWEKVYNYYVLSFVSTGDIPEGLELYAKITVKEGDKIALLPKPSVEGYIFDGWYYNGEYYAPASIMKMPSNDVVMTCVWTKIPEETTTQPETTAPVVTDPVTTQPIVTEPATTQPTTTKPVVTEPSTTKPTTTKPTTTKPVVTEPETTKPVSTTTKPTTTKPATTKPATTRPAEPTTKPTTQPVINVNVEIRNPSITTIKYGDSIILHAEIKGELPQGAKIVWKADNSNFTIVSTAIDGKNCTVTPNANGNTVFTATVVDKDGREIDSDTQTMTSKAGFFQKIIAFFKKLFGLTKLYPEAFIR